MNLSGATFSDHAIQEAGRREIAFGDPPRQYLLRVFVDMDRSPPRVVTVYRTSKIAKYTAAP
ncbi:MAG: hypothetical protein HQL43_10985 [Alphaproteobacteria bacterium]|nr:hypothetical protein [Alphaproteobacteria bacterium]